MGIVRETWNLQMKTISFGFLSCYCGHCCCGHYFELAIMHMGNESYFCCLFVVYLYS